MTQQTIDALDVGLFDEPPPVRAPMAKTAPWSRATAAVPTLGTPRWARPRTSFAPWTPPSKKMGSRGIITRKSALRWSRIRRAAGREEAVRASTTVMREPGAATAARACTSCRMAS